MNKIILKLCLILAASSVSAASTHPNSASLITAARTSADSDSISCSSYNFSADSFHLSAQNRQPESSECLKRMLVFQNKLYIDTGEISTAARCGVMDGTIKKTTAADKIPKKELQSNFGKGYGFQYGRRENRLEVCIDGTFHIFAYHENNFDGVSMKVKQSSPKTAALVITNTTDHDVIFGEEFLLEKKNGKTKEWDTVPYKFSDFAFNDAGHIAAKGTSVTRKADWRHIYGTLKPGTYRIVKRLYEEKDGKQPDCYTLTAKFRIEPK